MRTTWIALVLVLLSPFLACCLPQGQPPFSLAISAAEAVQSGSEIAVKITLTNSSDHEIVLIDGDRECDYGADVRGQDGMLASETQHKRDLKCKRLAFNGKKSITSLKPHKSMEDVLFVNQLYDMSHPGRYVVQLSREIPKELGKGIVASNSVTINVTE